MLALACIIAMFGSLPGDANPAWPPAVVNAALLGSGLCIGAYGTLVGIGGGPLIVPILVFFYGWDPRYVVGTSLFVVFLNALSGTTGYVYQQRIDYAGGIKFSLAALPGSVASGLVHRYFRVESFGVIFGVFLLALAVYCMVGLQKLRDEQRKRPKTLNPAHRLLRFRDRFGSRYRFTVNDSLGLAFNFALGFLVGFLGIGGGVLQVPMLVFALRYPVHLATATSHFITLITCTYALVPSIAFGHVRFDQGLWMGLGVVIGAQAGAWLSPRLQSRAILGLFTCVILAFAARLILG